MEKKIIEFLSERDTVKYGEFISEELFDCALILDMIERGIIEVVTTGLVGEVRFRLSDIVRGIIKNNLH